MRYRLICEEGHEFDQDFSNSSQFDEFKAAGHLMCLNGTCTSTKIEKTVMAPNVARSNSNRSSEAEYIEAWRKKIAASTYVGSELAERLRAGEKNIWGDVGSLEEAKQIMEEHPDIGPLPPEVVPAAHKLHKTDLN